MYLPGANRAVRNMYTGKTSKAGPQPGETVHCVVLGGPGEVVAWYDSYEATKSGGCPASFCKRVDGRSVWHKGRPDQDGFASKEAADKMIGELLEGAA